MLLNDLKILCNIDKTDTSEDDLLNLYIKKAIKVIEAYCNTKLLSIELFTEDEPLYDAVLTLATIYYSKKGNEGIVQATQGSRSATYDKDLPTEVKVMCKPYIVFSKIEVVR